MALVLLHASQGSQQAKKTEMPIQDSSFLMHVSYDEQSMALTVTMKSGSQYIYNYVYPQVMSDFMEARDKSRYYAQNVRGKIQSIRIINKTIGTNSKTKTKK